MDLWQWANAWPWSVTTALTLCLALVIDAIWGEPAARCHPVVWMGRALQAMQGWVFADSSTPSPTADSVASAGIPGIFWRGALAWCALALGFTLVAWALQWLLQLLPGPLAAVLLALAFKPMLAWRMLRQEVQQVEQALQQSLEQGQQQLARLVSRDTQVLNATQVRESALESLSENLNDSVIAPLFWFAMLGLPGAVLYRFANTADAMWGYPGERGGRYWWWAGKWAARCDDVLSFIPARLTALLLLLGAWLLWLVQALSHKHAADAKPSLSLGELRLEAKQTPSPNSGWPMATMAVLLGIRLSKPGVYVLHAAGRAAQPADTPRAVRLATAAVWLGAVLVTVLLCVVSC